MFVPTYRSAYCCLSQSHLLDNLVAFSRRYLMSTFGEELIRESGRVKGGRRTDTGVPTLPQGRPQVIYRRLGPFMNCAEHRSELPRRFKKDIGRDTEHKRPRTGNAGTIIEFHWINCLSFSVVIRTLRYDNGLMTSREFVRRARDYARKTGQSFRFDPTHGKGSHGRVYVGARFTTVQRGDLGKGVLTAMLRQLDIDRREF